MADGIYVTMCGAAARSEQLDAVADNLANAQTPGYKASRPAFEAFLPASGAADKSYPAAVATQVDVRPGAVAQTGNALDVLPEDGAFLAVQNADGTRAYTRDGHLTVDAGRRLVQGGRPVLDVNGAQVSIPPGAAPRITGEGAVEAGGFTVGQLGLYQLSGAVDRVGRSLYVPGAGGRAQPVAGGRVRTGQVELSNASPLDGMVQLISAQRHFDASMQALQTYRSLDQHGSDLGRVR
ncbi:MAG TPA: flagellar hook basal-body protein [Anaeromyxobacteraceae bacterium]|nr:flagellar hook basal-body protein [Anaeromyxobacteraceae bacterium]